MFSLLLLQAQTGSAPGVVWRTLRQLASDILERLPYLAIGLVVVIAFWLSAFAVARVLSRAAERTRLNNALAILLGRLAQAVAGILGLLVAAVIVFPAFKPGDLIAGLGITSVAIGFAFKDILQNFLAGILILWRQPFRVGDEIRSGTWEGTVDDINTRSTWLKTYDGERVVVPNGEIYTSAILVRTAYPKRRVKFTVGIGYPDSIEEARRTVQDAVERIEGVAGNPGPWVYVAELAPSSVNLNVFFWTDSAQANVLSVSDQVATAIKRALDQAQIDMPYPHNVVLWHDQTGSRDGDRAPVTAHRNTGNHITGGRRGGNTSFRRKTS